MLPSIKAEGDYGLYDTFLKLRGLLEEYAPSWYSDDLREEVEMLVQRRGDSKVAAAPRPLKRRAVDKRHRVLAPSLVSRSE
jgi:hypothetical protein